MYTWLFPEMASFSVLTQPSDLGFSPVSFTQLLQSEPLPLCSYPRGYTPIAIDIETQRRYVLRNEEYGAKEGELYEYSIGEQILRGPLFYYDNKLGFRGITGDYAFFEAKNPVHTRRVSLLDGSFTELPENYGFTFGGVDGDALLFNFDYVSKNLYLTRLGQDGEVYWRVEINNGNQPLFFFEYKLIVCTIWHPHPKAYGVSIKCTLMLLDVNTGNTLDTIPLDELLAAEEGQVVMEGNTLYARSRKALYAYHLVSREPRRFPLPEVMSSRAFLVAEGKAYFADNEEGGARVYVVSAQDGHVIGSRFFAGLKLNNMSSRISRFNDGYAMTLDNATELPGWHYQRAIAWRDGEMEDANATLNEEALRVEIVRELEGRDSRYRIGMVEPRPFEEVLRQMSIGIESAAYQAAIDVYNDTKAYDEDFSGVLIVDFSNQSLTEEDKRLFDTRLQRMHRIELAQFRSAVDNEKLTVTTVYE